MRARLGVNIDHVATLRQARGEEYPSISRAAREVLEAGADQITIHLREDRRHIQDPDVAAVKLVCERYNKPLNLELAAETDIVDIAIETKPEWICLVPEKREEKTTEGGLNLKDQNIFNGIKNTMDRLRKEAPNSKVSLFVEANEEVLQKCIDLKADAVEIHTGEFAIAVNNQNDIQPHLDRYTKAYEQMKKAGIGFHAGHGLTDESTRILVEKGEFVEYNIGHWMIGESVFIGLKSIVGKMQSIIKG